MYGAFHCPGGLLLALLKVGFDEHSHGWGQIWNLALRYFFMGDCKCEFVQ
jgi:hypothetical protein